MFYLSLNRAALILVPPQEVLEIQEPIVVQVIVKCGEDECGSDRHISLPTIDMIAKYYAIQVEVTQAVRNLVVYDLVTPVDLQDRTVDIDGVTFVLRGTKKLWQIADQLDGSLRWGTGPDSKVRMAKNKWVFELEMREDVEDQVAEEEAEMNQVEKLLTC
ncbi:hypothetical protein V5O48_005976 [Marasmius crinis-equi]|uniref:Uncharacterized protein n=1 Tax=Marasmius crinis-equi TaxID=585013 RepID=A0ABR3FKT8_9AGAR